LAKNCTALSSGGRLLVLHPKLAEPDNDIGRFNLITTSDSDSVAAAKRLLGVSGTEPAQSSVQLADVIEARSIPRPRA